MTINAIGAVGDKPDPDTDQMVPGEVGDLQDRVEALENAQEEGKEESGKPKILSTSTGGEAIPAGVTTSTSSAAESRPQGTRMVGRMDSVIHGVMRALGGASDKTYSRDANGNLVVSETPSKPGTQWKRMIAGALAGMGAGMQVSRGPGGAMRAGGAGIQAGMKLAQGQEQKKRDEANEDFEMRQKALKFKADYALKQQQLAAAVFTNKRAKIQATFDDTVAKAKFENRLAEYGDSAADLGIIRDVKSTDELRQKHPELFAHHANMQIMAVPVSNEDGELDGLRVAFVPEDAGERRNIQDEPHEKFDYNKYAAGDKHPFRIETIPAGSMKRKEIDIADMSEWVKPLALNKAQADLEHTKAETRAANARADATAEGKPEKPEKPQDMGTAITPDGRIVAGTISELQAAGVDAKNVTKAGAAEAEKIMNARVLSGQFDQTLQRIDALNKNGEIGALASRWNKLLSRKVGIGDPEFTAMLADVGLNETALMQVHVGARGGSNLLEHFKQLADAGKLNYTNLRAAVQEEQKYIDRKAMWVKTPSHASAAPQGTPVYQNGKVIGYTTDGKTMIPAP